MPKATMREEDEWKLPKDIPLPATLIKVSTKTINWKDKDSGEDKSRDKWEWEFQVSEGVYAGLSAWGETEDKLTTHVDNKVRQWGETLRGKPFDLGEGLDTDDLLGLSCVIAVDNQVYVKKDGTNSYLCPVLDVYPSDALASIQADDPPF